MQQAAADVALRYCSDTEPGFARIKVGKGFAYKDREGKRISDPKQIDRIAALVIPPAWTDVWIAPSKTCHIQATGRDARGRKQYRYHDRWTACRDESKFGGLAHFGEALPKLRRAIERDLSQRGLTRDKVLATILWILDHVMIRIGNLNYARDNGSFGLTTLRDRHASISGSRLKLRFIGKSGKEWERMIDDKRIVRIVKGTQDLPGQRLFQYLDDDGQRHAVSSEDVNAYIRDNGGDGFTSKHFRTWAATVLAAREFVDLERPDSEAARRKARNTAIDNVADVLGNTRAVCGRCYIHPAVIEAWEAGSLPKQLEKAGRRVSRAPAHMERFEALVQRFLSDR